MSKIIGTILIIGSIALGYLGVNKIVQGDKSVEIFNIEIDASNKSKQNEGYIYIGLAVVLFAGGAYILRK